MSESLSHPQTRSGPRYGRYRWNCTALGFTKQLTGRCRTALGKSNTCRREGLFFFCTVEVHRTDTGLPRVAGWAGPIQCTLGAVSQRDQHAPCDHGRHATGSAAHRVWSQQGPGARNVPASAPVWGGYGSSGQNRAQFLFHKLFSR